MSGERLDDFLVFGICFPDFDCSVGAAGDKEKHPFDFLIQNAFDLALNRKTLMK